MLSISTFSLFAQNNNLKVNFKDAASSPRNMNVCGDETTVTVTISTEGFSASPRQNIQARLNLFKGVQLVRFELAGSSPGVSLTDISDPNHPMFNLPPLVPNSTASVNIQYVIKVNCSYTDTLTQNDALSVVDKWDMTYDLGATTGLSESDLSTEYRDQIKVPFFTMAVTNNAPNGARIGQCYERTVVVNNSGLDGWVKSCIYTNTQGAGISIKNLKVNGVSVPFTKTATFNADGDSLITVSIPDSLFKYNTRGVSGGPADGDNLFEPDETVTITEDICVANCDKSRISHHEMAWGCESRFCNTVKRQDIVRLGQGSVNVGFSSSGSTPALDGGYCSNGSQTVTFTNTGVEVDAGTGTMFDISTGIGISDSFKVAINGYKITGIKIGNITIPSFANTLIDIKNNPLFSTDPDGAGGLQDMDGDGFFDDLAVNEKFEITVNYEVDCGVSLTNREDYCTNDFEASFSARLDYTDLCQNRSKYVQDRFFAPSNTNDYVENCIDPDGKTDGSTFFIEHLEIRNVFNFERNCGGEEEMIIAVKMPQGVSPVRDSMWLHWFDDNLPLKEMWVSNDTVYMTYNAAAAQYLNGEYRTRLAFKADCSTIPGASKFPINIEYYCPPCDCHHMWYCDTLNGPRIHYTEGGVCPPNPLYDCVKGLKTTDFKVERTTFGFTDETYTAKVDATTANTKVAMTCDSIKMTVKNVVGQTPLADSIGLLISYDNIVSSDTNKLKDIFIFDKGQVVITHGGTQYTCAIDASKVRVVRTDTTKAMYFDFHSCLIGLGIAPLSKGDSVNFVGNFSVNPEAPIKFTFEKVPNFRAFGYYVEDDSLYSCDNYGAMFRIGKSQALFSFPSSSSFPVGCSEANLEYKITMFNNDYQKYFGEEYRQSVGVDSFALAFDRNFSQAFTTSVSVSIPDHPFFGNNYFPMPDLTNSGTYAARFDTLTKVPSLNRLTGYAFNLKIKITPNCASISGSTNGDSIYSFKPTIYYRDRYYARSIGDGSCSPYKIEKESAGNDHITHSNGAILQFIPITNPSITIVNDTAEWTVKLCNQSEKGGATNTWIGVAPSTSAPSFRVLSMTDVTNNLNQKVLNFKYYGLDSTKAFSFLEGITPVTPEKTIDDVCNVVKIVAVYKECGANNIDFKAGWLCALPTNPAWNPTAYAPCADSTIKAQVRTENPFIDANFINQSLNAQANICDTTILEVLLRNTDLGNIYDLKTRLTIPLQGARLVPGSIAVAYPPSAAYQTVVDTSTYVGADQRGKNYEFKNFKALSDHLNKFGLKGFNPASPNDSNEFKIRFKFVTDCDFRSGSLAYFSFVGKTVCGTASNFETGESLPIQIQGAQLTSPKVYQVSNGINNKFVPGGVSNIEIHFKNISTTPSDSADEVSVKLPVGVTYKAGKSSAITPSTWNVKEPRIRYFGDIQVVSWQQPVGLLQNEEAALQFSVNTADTLPCSGIKDMALATFALKDLVCNTFGTTCKTEIITTSGGEKYFNIPLSRGGISLVSNLPIYTDTLTTLAGDTVVIAGIGAQRYQWIDADNGIVLSTDSLYKFVPSKFLTNIIVKSALTGGCVDSAIVHIKVSSSLERHDTVFIGDSLKFCFSNLILNGAIDSVENVCKTTSNRHVEYTVDSNNCLIIKGLNVGTDTACYRVCTALGTCKEIKFYTTAVLRPVDTIRITQNVGDTTTVCFSTKYLGGKKFVLTNFCANALDTVAQYSTKDTCVIVKAIGVGVSKSCWAMCDTLGHCDSTIIVTTVKLPNTQPKRDTIYRFVNIGFSDTFCLTFNRPRTTPIRSICPDSSGVAVRFEIYKDSCIISKGLKIGRELSCWQLCDTTNKCDTIFIVTTVGEGKKPPIAINDTVKTRVNVAVRIPVLQNDTLNGKLKSIKLMLDPIYGQGVFVQDSSGTWVLEYIPNKDFCGSKKIDEFIYQICNDYGCDTAMVLVRILCDKLVIYNGFSPNGDSKNDFFTIDGLELYPNTKVIIYNRWGNRVYKDDDYKNTWGGTWDNKPLPDGTYFYQVILENGDVYTGYLVILR